MFIHIHLPQMVIQTSSCTILLYKFVLQTALGMGMGMSVAAQFHRFGTALVLFRISRFPFRRFSHTTTFRQISLSLSICIYIYIYILLPVYITRFASQWGPTLGKSYTSLPRKTKRVPGPPNPWKMSCAANSCDPNSVYGRFGMFSAPYGE